MLLVLHNVWYNLSSSFGFLFHLFPREYFYTMHNLKTCMPGIFIKWGKYTIFNVFLFTAQAQPDPVLEVKQEVLEVKEEEIKPDVKQEVKQEIKEAIEEAKKDETVVMDVSKVFDTTVEKHMHAHPHVQHVHDEITHEYYLPLLIGTAIGVAAIFCLLLAILCICCRRRIKKKIYVEREPEKPKLFEGIYTIGVPPPVYEVNGIPPLSYEEVRGIKITGSPSSVRRHNEENAENSSRRGVVSDI